MAQHHLGQSLHLLTGINHTRGVGGAGENHSLGIRGNGLLQHIGSHLKASVLGGLDNNRRGASHFNSLFVGHPVRGGQDHLVPGVADGLKGYEHVVLGTAGHTHLLGLILHTVLAEHPVTDGLAQGHNARSRSITGLVITDSFDGGHLYRVRSGEIRLTGTETDDINTVRFHLLGQRVHSNSRGRSDALGNFGNRLHIG